MSATPETNSSSTPLPQSALLSSPPPQETKEVKEHEIKAPSAPVDLAMPVVGVETFLQRAQRDHKRCQTIVTGLRSTFNSMFLPDDLFPKSREDMVTLLGRRIEAAERSGYDDELYVAYQTVAEMIQGWYFAGNLRGIMNRTLQAVREGRLVRQPFRYPVQQVTHLRQQNGSLQRALEAKTQEMEAAALRHTQELKAKEEEIRKKDATIDRLTNELTQARSDLEEARKNLGEARNDLSQARDDFLSAKNDLQQLMMQQTRRPATPPSPSAGYGPGFFGKNTATPKRKGFKLFQRKKTQAASGASPLNGK